MFTVLTVKAEISKGVYFWSSNNKYIITSEHGLGSHSENCYIHLSVRYVNKLSFFNRTSQSRYYVMKLLKAIIVTENLLKSQLFDVKIQKTITLHGM